MGALHYLSVVLAISLHPGFKSDPSDATSLGGAESAQGAQVDSRSMLKEVERALEMFLPTFSKGIQVPIHVFQLLTPSFNAIWPTHWKR